MAGWEWGGWNMVLSHQAPVVCLESGGQSIFEMVLAGHHPPHRGSPLKFFPIKSH